MRVGGCIAGALGAALLTTSCGYTLATPGAGLPQDVRSLYVADVGGDSGDPEVRDALSRELRRVVRARGYFDVTDVETGADAVLRVRFVDFITRPVAFDKFDEVLDYETTMRVDATLEDAGGRCCGEERGSNRRVHTGL